MENTKRNPILLLFSFCMIFFVFSHSQTDTIEQGQDLKHGMQLFSASGIFRLGFFQLGPENFSYVGIWYNNRDNENPVWVANRNNPIVGDSGVLGIDQYGNLKISQKAGDPITLHDSIQAPTNASATLLDSGNFVLRESNQVVLWQSFDYPTDTLLPKMKLGFDRETGINRTLTSWRSDDFPALGSFTLALDPISTDQMFVWWRGSKYWASGAWRKGCFDSLEDEFCDPYRYNFSYESNENETYFSYSVHKGITIFPRLTLSPDGEIRGYGMNLMFTGVSCLGSSSSSSMPSLRFGCVEQKVPSCRRGSRGKFVSKVGVVSREGFKFSANDNLTIADCWEKCFQNCSCVAYASANDNGTGCEIWTKASSFTENNLATLREVHILDSGGKK